MAAQAVGRWFCPLVPPCCGSCEMQSCVQGLRGCSDGRWDPGGLQEDLAHPCARVRVPLGAWDGSVLAAVSDSVSVLCGEKGSGRAAFCSVSAGNADVSDGFCLMVSFLLGPAYYRWNRWK